MRHANWDERLMALVACWRNQPFVWGQSDCAQFALAVLKAVSARDWAQLGVQPYRTARQAQAMLRRLNVADMAGLATLLLGPPHPAAFARRGDLVSCPSRFGPALGVCLGQCIAVPGEQGLVLRPLFDATSCWRV